MEELLNRISEGFKSVKVDQKYKDQALSLLREWLSDPMYIDYRPQIEYLVEAGKWDLLLDSFYQVIPFGTAGRRGMVGIGPNRINTVTIRSSAQGHSQYLYKKYGADAAKRGVVIAYDVRQYLQTGVYDDNRPNPVKGLSCRDLAEQAGEVYTANGIHIYIFPVFTTTPETSFMVRHLKAVAGIMISASHNPPEYNGKKVMDEFGSQLLPPLDEMLVNVVVNEVQQVKSMPYQEAQAKGLVTTNSEADHESYLQAALAQNIGDYSGVKILYSSFHGCSINSAFSVLQKLGFDVSADPASCVYDPKFSTNIYNIPNPEVVEAYNNLLPEADRIGADVIMVADPDGDRFGLMSKEAYGWQYYTGNDFFVLTAAYMLEELQAAGKLKPASVIIKTVVTTEFTRRLTDAFGVRCDSEHHYVGIKYIADGMKKLMAEGHIDDFIMGGEESNGLVCGDYILEKDACSPAIMIARLASREKAKGVTLGQYYNSLFEKYGYYYTFQKEIRLPGAEGMTEMAKIQDVLRSEKPEQIGRFKVTKFTDFQEGAPFLSNSDKISRNVLSLEFETRDPYNRMTVAVRPSGTEPKTKVYFEIGCQPGGDLEQQKEDVKLLAAELEKVIMLKFYQILGLQVSERIFLLFNQMSLPDKLHYFEIEPQLAALRDLPDKVERRQKLTEMTAFLGSDPLLKVDKAFNAQYGAGIEEYLELK